MNKDLFAILDGLIEFPSWTLVLPPLSPKSFVFLKQPMRFDALLNNFHQRGPLTCLRLFHCLEIDYGSSCNLTRVIVYLVSSNVRKNSVSNGWILVDHRAHVCECARNVLAIVGENEPFA